MGADLYHTTRQTNQTDASRYRALRRRLARLLGLTLAHDVTGPGDHQGATDDDIYVAVEALVVAAERES